jgi:hypothetical protein
MPEGVDLNLAFSAQESATIRNEERLGRAEGMSSVIQAYASAEMNPPDIQTISSPVYSPWSS